jgi:hypothetical protein
LEAVSKPDVQVGKATLHRLNGRSMWIGVLNDKPIIRLWLRGKTLEDDHTYFEDADCAAAIRKLALKYKVKKVERAHQFGMLNT